MKKTLLFVLTLSGLAALSANIIKKYHYVKTSKTWDEAQSYCRETFTDFATVNNQDDNDRLQSLLKDGGQLSWIGLCDDAMRWKWSLGNAALLKNNFSNWAPTKPGIGNPMICTVMQRNGLWYDSGCITRRFSVCYDERGPAKYISVTTKRSWCDAQKYCRSKYTDLVSVRNMSENNQISSLLSGQTWIGYYSKNWPYWSDQTPRTFSNWHRSQPNMYTGRKACVTVSADTGNWFDYPCEQKFPFVCQTDSYPQRKTTFKLKFQSEADLIDPDVQQQILEQLHSKLEKHGVPDFKLRWIQTDGQTFHKEKDRKKEKGFFG